ncbi:MAG: alpha/beta fold hydrolase [Bdellovibrionales bacterium]
MATYQFENYSIGYTVLENAAPTDLVFLNGNLATSRWWLPTVEELKPSFKGQKLNGRMIFFELPGCGESLPVQGDLDVPTIAGQYLELIKHLRIEKAAILGHSTGGLLACWLMAKAPQVFSKGLLLDPVGAKGIQFDDAVLEKYEEMKTSKELTAAIIAFTIHNCDVQSAFFQQIIVEDTFKSVNQVGSRMIRALRGYNSEASLRQIQADVTILFGEKDILLPKADAQGLTSLIPNSKFIEVPGAGHCLNVENPKLMAQYIRDSLF